MNEHAYRRLKEYNSSLKAIDETYRGAARLFGMSECAFWVLYTLRVEEPPLTQSDICNLQYQPKQTVNSALKRLEADGVIELTHGSDRRSKYVRLTACGEQLAERTVDQIAGAEAQALAELTESEQETFFYLLNKYNRLLRTQLHALDRSDGK